jgi:hypothetical protein
MRKKFLLLSFSIIVAIGTVGVSFYTATSSQGGAPAGYTGSPFDNKTCAHSGCHPGIATVIFNAITSDVPVTGYEPGNTYNITTTLTDANLIKFGFQISPQSPSGALQGTMAILDAARTKLISSGKYITHTLSGTSFPSHTATWTFAWTAPPANTGEVTFYGAFNFTNNNMSTSGDVIRKSTLIIPEAFGVGISNAGNDISSLNVYPSPFTDHFSISYYLGNAESVKIELFDLSGKQIAVLANEMQPAGKYNPDFSIGKSLTSGVYIVVLNAGGNSFSKKIVRY